jgi:hypothetical protein
MNEEIEAVEFLSAVKEYFINFSKKTGGKQGGGYGG